ncbi:MAG: immunity 22 family protein [Acetatifactor sp.]|nr:immunity 22 family protein [Acetatifactor sp.]
MKENNESMTDYEKEGYLSIWLCNTASQDVLFQYLEIEYEDEDEDIEDDSIEFEMGRDFNISWYDEDFFEASHKGDMRGWDLLKGHSRMENIMPLLEQGYQDVLNDTYNSVIIFYNFKYDGNVKEVNSNQYGYFKFLGSFEFNF